MRRSANWPAGEPCPLRRRGWPRLAAVECLRVWSLPTADSDADDVLDGTTCTGGGRGRPLPCRTGTSRSGGSTVPAVWSSCSRGWRASARNESACPRPPGRAYCGHASEPTGGSLPHPCTGRSPRLAAFGGTPPLGGGRGRASCGRAGNSRRGGTLTTLTRSCHRIRAGRGPGSAVPGFVVQDSGRIPGTESGGVHPAHEPGNVARYRRRPTAESFHFVPKCCETVTGASPLVSVPEIDETRRSICPFATSRPTPSSAAFASPRQTIWSAEPAIRLATDHRAGGPRPRRCSAPPRRPPTIPGKNPNSERPGQRWALEKTGVREEPPVVHPPAVRHTHCVPGKGWMPAKCWRAAATTASGTGGPPIHAPPRPPNVTLSGPAPRTVTTQTPSRRRRSA